MSLVTANASTSANVHRLGPRLSLVLCGGLAATFNIFGQQHQEHEPTIIEIPWERPERPVDGPRDAETQATIRAEYERTLEEFRATVRRHNQAFERYNEAVERQRQVEAAYAVKVERRRAVEAEAAEVKAKYEVVKREYEAILKKFDDTYFEMRGRVLITANEPRKPVSDPMNPPASSYQGLAGMLLRDRVRSAEELAKSDKPISGIFSPRSEQALIDIYSIADAAKALKKVLAIAAFEQIFHAPRLRPSFRWLKAQPGPEASMVGELAPVSFKVSQADWAQIEQAMRAADRLARSRQQYIALLAFEQAKEDPDTSPEEIAFWIKLSKALQR